MQKDEDYGRKSSYRWGLGSFPAGGRTHTPDRKENNNTITRNERRGGTIFHREINRLGVSMSRVSGNLCARRSPAIAIADVVAPPLSVSIPLAQRSHYRTSGCLVYDNGSQYIWSQDQRLSLEKNWINSFHDFTNSGKSLPWQKIKDPFAYRCIFLRYKKFI